MKQPIRIKQASEAHQDRHLGMTCRLRPSPSLPRASWPMLREVVGTLFDELFKADDSVELQIVLLCFLCWPRPHGPAHKGAGVPASTADMAANLCFHSVLAPRRRAKTNSMSKNLRS